MNSPDWTDGGRARAASDALRDSAGWQGELRERIEGLSWDRFSGIKRPGKGIAASSPPGRPRSHRS